MESTEHKFPKSERLCGLKIVDELFATGQSFVKYPLRIVFTSRPKPDGQARMLVSVPKKKFKRAVRRNRIKRLVREAFRLNKQLLSETKTSLEIDIAFIYLDTEMPDFNRIERSVIAALSKIAERLPKAE